MTFRPIGKYTGQRNRADASCMVGYHGMPITWPILSMWFRDIFSCAACLF